MKLEQVNVPGIQSVFGYYTYDDDLNKLCSVLIEKIGEKPIEPISGSGLQAKEVIRICSRRSIFTSMDSEISTEKMFNSIGACIASLHQYLADITDHSLSQYVKSIVFDLDDLDGFSRNPPHYSVQFDEFSKREMNSLKISIIDKLHYLNAKFHLAMDLPNDIHLDHVLIRQHRLEME